MVLSGQDAWRKHPSISGRWKKPLPYFGVATGLFVAYLLLDTSFTVVTAPKKSEPPKLTVKFKETSEFGDSMPESKIIKKSHAHH